MRYTPNRNGLRGLLSTPRVQRHLVDRGELGRRHVLAKAPERSGGFKAGVVVIPGRSPKGDRAGAKLVATARNSAAVEFANRGSKGLLRSAIPVMEGKRR